MLCIVYDMSKDVRTVNEALEELNIARATLYLWIKRGEIRAYKRLGRTYIDKNDIDKINQIKEPLNLNDNKS